MCRNNVVQNGPDVYITLALILDYQQSEYDIILSHLINLKCGQQSIFVVF